MGGLFNFRICSVIGKESAHLKILIEEITVHIAEKIPLAQILEDLQLQNIHFPNPQGKPGGIPEDLITNREL